MPVFEYKCKVCHQKFSTLVQSFSTPDSEISCPDCNEKTVERSLSLKASIGGCSEKSECPVAASNGFS